MSSSDCSDGSGSASDSSTERKRAKKAPKREKKARKREKKARKLEKKELHRQKLQAEVREEDSPNWPLIVCYSDELHEGGCRQVEVQGQEVGVWRVNGQLYAVSNRCPHKKARLSLGDIEELGECGAGRHADGSAVGGVCLRCPKHRSKFGGGLYFSLSDGRSFTKVSCSAHPGPGSTMAIETYAVSESGGKVLLMPTAGGTHRTSGSGEAAGAPAQLQQAWTVIQVESHGPIKVLVARASGHPVLADVDSMSLWHVSIGHGSLTREYTPLSDTAAYRAGEIRLFVKVYPDGQLTAPVFSQVAPGDLLSLGRPEPTLTQAQAGALWRSAGLGLIAGGTGLTPVVMALVQAKRLNLARISVLCSSSTVEEALCASRFVDEVRHPTARVFHTLTGSSPPSWWRGFHRRIDVEMLIGVLPQPGPNTRVLLSGPESMMANVQSMLMNIGYVSENIIALDA